MSWRLHIFFWMFVSWHLFMTVINLIFTCFKGNKGLLLRLKFFLQIQPILLIVWLGFFIQTRYSYSVRVCLCRLTDEFEHFALNFWDYNDFDMIVDY